MIMKEGSDPQNNNPKKEFILDEFLIKTIVSLESTLATMEKDSDEKTDLLHDLADSITAIAYNMKELKEKADRNEHDIAKMTATIENVRTCLNIVEARLESDNNLVEGHVKEIKYAVQEFEKLLIALKHDTKNIQKKSFDFGGAWDAIKDVRWIFIIALLIVLILSAMVGGAGSIIEILKAIKGLIG